MKKGAAFLAVQSQQNDTQKFVIFFREIDVFFEKSAHSKKAPEAKSCHDSDMPQFESRQSLRNLHKNLWFKRRNPGSKKTGNG